MTDTLSRCCDMCGQLPCVNPGFCQTCRVEARKPRRRGINKPLSTPQTTIEAILHCVREGGIKALGEPANQERLSRCDGAAREQIEARIAKMKSSE